MVTWEVTPLEAIMPRDTPDQKVNNGGIPDTRKKVFIGIFVSKTKKAWSLTIITLILGLVAEQFRLQFSVSFLFSVSKVIGRDYMGNPAKISQSSSQSSSQEPPQVTEP